MSDRQILAVILAGGSGSRLWPLSRQHLPKQCLSLDGVLISKSDQTQLVREVVDTLQRRGATKRIYHTRVNPPFA